MLKPMHDMVLIKEFEEETTDSGIFMPSSVNDAIKRAEVVDKGPGKLYNGDWVTPDVSSGDIVIVASHSGYPIRVNATDKYTLVRYFDIIAKEEDEQ